MLYTNLKACLLAANQKSQWRYCSDPRLQHHQCMEVRQVHGFVLQTLVYKYLCSYKGVVQVPYCRSTSLRHLQCVQQGEELALSRPVGEARRDDPIQTNQIWWTWCPQCQVQSLGFPDQDLHGNCCPSFLQAQPLPYSSVQKLCCPG